MIKQDQTHHLSHLKVPDVDLSDKTKLRELSLKCLSFLSDRRLDNGEKCQILARLLIGLEKQEKPEESINDLVVIREHRFGTDQLYD